LDRLAVAHRSEDRPVVVGGVDHQHLLVVADEPHVVVDVEVLAVDAEGARRDHSLNCHPCSPLSRVRSILGTEPRLADPP